MMSVVHEPLATCRKRAVAESLTTSSSSPLRRVNFIHKMWHAVEGKGNRSFFQYVRPLGPVQLPT